MSGARSVLHVFDCVSQQYGSFEQFSLALARTLRSAGCKVAFAYSNTPKSGRYLADLSEVGVEVLTVPAGHLKKFVWLRRQIRLRQPVIVHVHFSTSRYFCGALSYDPTLSFKLFYTRHGEGEAQRRSTAKLTRWLSSRVERIVAVSQTVKNVLVQTGVRAQKVEVVYLGVDTERDTRTSRNLAKEQLAAIFGMDPNLPWVVSTSHYRPGKGMDILGRALRSLGQNGSRFCAILAGDGPLRKGLQEMFASDGQIVLPGVLPDVRLLLDACDIFVFPTDGPEGMGMSAVEALAAGRVVVATAVAELPQLIQHRGNGFLVEPGSDLALSTAIDEALSLSEPERLAMEAEAEKSVRHLERTAQVHNLLDLYDQALRK